MRRVQRGMRRLLTLLLAFAPVAAGGPLTASRGGDAKARALKARGGSEATEKAVALALEWLAAHQEAEGRWDADGFDGSAGCDCDGKGGGWHGEAVPCAFDREVTALATLAFLGAGQTHREGEHKERLRRALDWLAAGIGQGTLFAIAFSTQALAEVYDRTGDEGYLPAIRTGVQAMVGSRQAQGGWRYHVGNTMASGVPTTTAVVCALERAAAAGIDVDTGYREPVLAWLRSLIDRESGKVRYTLDADALGYTPTTTNAASALLIHSLMRIPSSDERIRLGLSALAKQRPRWSIRFKRLKVNGEMRDVQIGYLQHYYWHHGTEALARLGGDAWTSWNASLKKALLPHQRKEGHAKGSWDPVGTYGNVGGRVYSTALCAMMLESYYRYP